MNSVTERLQSLLDQELHSAIANQREPDYRHLFQVELNLYALTDAEWFVLLYQLLSLSSAGDDSRKRSAPSNNCRAGSSSGANLPLAEADAATPASNQTCKSSRDSGLPADSASLAYRPSVFSTS